MGCTGTKTNKNESNIERYHQDIFEAVQSGDVKRFQDILNELNGLKRSAIKKEVLNMGM